jgi:hypothetical protein
MYTQDLSGCGKWEPATGANACDCETLSKNQVCTTPFGFHYSNGVKDLQQVFVELEQNPSYDVCSNAPNTAYKEKCTPAGCQVTCTTALGTANCGVETCSLSGKCETCTQAALEEEVIREDVVQVQQTSLDNIQKTNLNNIQIAAPAGPGDQLAPIDNPGTFVPKPTYPPVVVDTCEDDVDAPLGFVTTTACFPKCMAYAGGFTGGFKCHSPIAEEEPDVIDVIRLQRRATPVGAQVPRHFCANTAISCPDCERCEACVRPLQISCLQGGAPTLIGGVEDANGCCTTEFEWRCNNGVIKDLTPLLEIK